MATISATCETIDGADWTTMTGAGAVVGTIT